MDQFHDYWINHFNAQFNPIIKGEFMDAPIIVMSKAAGSTIPKFPISMPGKDHQSMSVVSDMAVLTLSGLFAHSLFIFILVWDPKCLGLWTVFKISSQICSANICDISVHYWYHQLAASKRGNGQFITDHTIKK